MSQNLRIATFNCENLFSRPRIFGKKRERSLELLGYVSLLQDELTKDVFDHNRIKELKKKLSGYAKINNVRGKYDKVAGAAEWLGWIELTRRKAGDGRVRSKRVIGQRDRACDWLCCGLTLFRARSEQQRASAHAVARQSERNYDKKDCIDSAFSLW